ncbi:MAG: hypothetical protein K1060chlam1_00068 [Candidatus Anoxychlamydiales bacterium]|nr:hypothetical protein [Candidatus Anoxychlamydiales bacterium]
MNKLKNKVKSFLITPKIIKKQMLLLSSAFLICNNFFILSAAKEMSLLKGVLSLKI